MEYPLNERSLCTPHSTINACQRLPDALRLYVPLPYVTTGNQVNFT